MSLARTISVLSLLLLPLFNVFAHKEYVHQYLAIEAMKLLLHDYPGLVTSPLPAHVGTQSGDCSGFQFTDGMIATGAYREDCEDPVYHYGDLIPGLDNAYFSASHFWNADAGDNSTLEICDVTCGLYQNAYQKSLRYVLPGVYGTWTAKLTWPRGLSHFYLQAGGTGSIFHYGMIGFEYDDLAQFYRDGACRITGYLDVTGKWQTASTVPDQLPMEILAPQNVRDRIAWEVIGRIAHLLGDMGVPAHAHNDIHPPFWWNNEPADIYEEEMGSLYTVWTFRDALAQGGRLDIFGSVPSHSPERIMRYLFYTVNQVADRFPSNDRDGDTVYDLAWGEDDYLVLGLIDAAITPVGSRDIFHRETADFAFVYSIRAIAGLYEWFAVQTGMLNVVTLSTNFPGGRLLVNDKPGGSPVTLILPAGSAFTAEASDQWTTDLVTDLPVKMLFQKWEPVEGTEGSIPPGEVRFEAVGAPWSAYTAIFEQEVIVVPDPPEAPALSGSTVMVGSIRYPRLSWTAGAGVSLFRLYRYTCADGLECIGRPRPALIYEGPERAFTDGYIMVGTKLADSRAYYYVEAVAGEQVSPPSNTVSYGIQGNVVWSAAVGGDPTALVGIYPNPFNPSTTVAYTLAGEATVTLKVYNVLGEVVGTIFEGREDAGAHSREWDASRSPAGVYFLELTVSEVNTGGVYRERKKVIQLK